MGTSGHEVIELEEQIDPTTGKAVFAVPGALDDARDSELSLRDGRLVETSDAGAGGSPSIALSTQRFSATGDDPWSAAEQHQDSGGEARIVNGRLVFGPGDDDEPSNAVSLSKDRFAALAPAELDDMRRLVASGAASMFVKTLQPTSQMRQHFPADPGGVYLHTAPTRLGDELHVVITRDPSTRLHHANLWTFMLNEHGSLKPVDLNRWVGTDPTLSAHRTHLYPGVGRQGAVLCLSTSTRGGMPTLADCVIRSAQWAYGMGEVVRGRSWPYRE